MTGSYKGKKRVDFKLCRFPLSEEMEGSAERTSGEYENKVTILAKLGLRVTQQRKT